MAIKRKFTIKAKHDVGYHSSTIENESLAKAVSIFCEIEGCPEHAIVSIKCTDIPVKYYKVVRFFRKSEKRKTLHTNRTREQAIQLAKSYPSNPGKSFVGFVEQRSRYAETK